MTQPVAQMGNNRIGMEETKERRMTDQLNQANRIRSGLEPMGFWLWQRINTELTGECIAFLPAKPKG
jgi:hypothetical protein